MESNSTVEQFVEKCEQATLAINANRAANAMSLATKILDEQFNDAQRHELSGTFGITVRFDRGMAIEVESSCCSSTNLCVDARSE